MKYVLKWLEDASCKGLANKLGSFDVFFPAAEGSEVPYVAATICASCSVRDQCEDYAIRNNIEMGIFGGKSATVRRSRRRQYVRKREEYEEEMTPVVAQVVDLLESRN